jgi:hypothetical protein
MLRVDVGRAMREKGRVVDEAGLHRPRIQKRAARNRSA